MPSKKHIVFPVLCHYCKEPLTRLTHTWDHVVPRSGGGLSTPANLVHACQNCNSRKSSQSVEEFLSQPIPAAAPSKKARRSAARKELDLEREKDLDRILALPWVILTPARCQFCKQARKSCADCR